MDECRCNVPPRSARLRFSDHGFALLRRAATSDRRSGPSPACPPDLPNLVLELPLKLQQRLVIEPDMVQLPQGQPALPETVRDRAASRSDITMNIGTGSHSTYKLQFFWGSRRTLSRPRQGWSSGCGLCCPAFDLRRRAGTWLGQSFRRAISPDGSFLRELWEKLSSSRPRCLCSHAQATSRGVGNASARSATGKPLRRRSVGATLPKRRLHP
jgi:hypothetical protein